LAVRFPLPIVEAQDISATAINQDQPHHAAAKRCCRRRHSPARPWTGSPISPILRGEPSVLYVATRRHPATGQAEGGGFAPSIWQSGIATVLTVGPPERERRPEDRIRPQRQRRRRHPRQLQPGRRRRKVGLISCPGQHLHPRRRLRRHLLHHLLRLPPEMSPRLRPEDDAVPPGARVSSNRARDSDPSLWLTDAAGPRAPSSRAAGSTGSSPSLPSPMTTSSTTARSTASFSSASCACYPSSVWWAPASSGPSCCPSTGPAAAG
jgi:hypothetical protein